MAPVSEMAAEVQASRPNDEANGWAFLKDNFAVVSGLAVLGGLALAIIFLFAYLSVFDWHLIAFVQYVDVITFGIIAVGVVSGSFGLAYCCIQYFISVPEESEGRRRARWIVDGGIALVVVALLAWFSVRSRHGYFHIVTGALVLAGVGFITWGIVYVFRRRMQPTVGRIMGAAAVIFAMAGLCGQWVAYSVLEESEFDQNVRGKDWNLDNAKVVIVMSRFTVLLREKNLYIVPTADIVQFRNTRPLTMILSTSSGSQTSSASSVQSPQRAGSAPR
jgi:uncharacterized membrane protein YuzA (DUF378 family)